MVESAIDHISIFRDAKFHSELNDEINHSIGAMSNWSFLINSTHSYLSSDLFEGIGPFLHRQNVLKTINLPVEVNAQVLEHYLNSWLLEWANDRCYYNQA
jgi:hypothetical protein